MDLWVPAEVADSGNSPSFFLGKFSIYLRKSTFQIICSSSGDSSVPELHLHGLALLASGLVWSASVSSWTN